MALTVAQRAAANLAVVELRAFQRRAYVGSLLAGALPGQDEASQKTILGNLSRDSELIDVLEIHLDECATGDRTFEAWVAEAGNIHDDVAYQANLGETFQSWDALKSAASATVDEVKTTATNVVAPAAAGTLVVVGLVALAYLVFTVRR